MHLSTIIVIIQKSIIRPILVFYYCITVNYPNDNDNQHRGQNDNETGIKCRERFLKTHKYLIKKKKE